MKGANKIKIVLDYLIRLRFVILIILLVIVANTVLALYNLTQFEAFTTMELKHEGLLLSHALEAGIASYAEVEDIPGLQKRIDRFVAARDNDIEVNIMLLDGDKSSIVASNIKENIEETSQVEHQNLLASLRNGKPVVFIGEEGEGEENISKDNTKEETFDFRAEKFLSITIPIIVKSKGIGSINVKLSLIPLYQKKEAIKLSILIATVIEILLILAGLAILTRFLIAERSIFLEEAATRLQVELKALQSQINPHFLFNTLNSLSSLIPLDPALAEELTVEIADLFRRILGASQKGWWAINEELDLVKSYLNIESIRLKEKLKFSIETSHDMENIHIPCLIIEPLVENAVKHGINTAVHGGKIAIDIKLNNDLSIRVENILNTDENYPISGSLSGEKTGIENIKKRLNIIYKENAKFTFSQTHEGAVSTIVIKNIRNSKNAKI